jgi:hypothetical protein
MRFLKTPALARELGVPYWRLINLLRFDKIVPPARDSSGDFLWSDADIMRARQALEPIHREPREAATA